MMKLLNDNPNLGRRRREETLTHPFLEAPRKGQSLVTSTPTVKVGMRLGVSSEGGHVLAAAAGEVRAWKGGASTHVPSMLVGTRCPSSLTPPRRCKNNEDGEITTMKFISSFPRSKSGGQVRDAQQRVPTVKIGTCLGESNGGGHLLAAAAEDGRAPKTVASSTHVPSILVGMRCPSSLTLSRRRKYNEDGEITTKKFISSFRISNDGGQVRDARQHVPTVKDTDVMSCVVDITRATHHSRRHP
jgi:hypothetical protein